MKSLIDISKKIEEVEEELRNPGPLTEDQRQLDKVIGTLQWVLDMPDTYNYNPIQKVDDTEQLFASIGYLCHALRTGDGLPENKHGSPLGPQFLQMSEMVMELIYSIEALNYHLQNGGELPKVWQR